MSLSGVKKNTIANNASLRWVERSRKYNVSCLSLFECHHTVKCSNTRVLCPAVQYYWRGLVAAEHAPAQVNARCKLKVYRSRRVFLFSCMLYTGLLASAFLFTEHQTPHTRITHAHTIYIIYTTPVLELNFDAALSKNMNI